MLTIWRSTFTQVAIVARSTSRTVGCCLSCISISCAELTKRTASPPPAPFVWPWSSVIGRERLVEEQAPPCERFVHPVSLRQHSGISHAAESQARFRQCLFLLPPRHTRPD